MTITEFLTARLDEAQTAAEGRDSEAPIHQVGCYYYHQQIDPREWTAEHCDCEESAKAFTLADIAAKRAIVAQYVEAETYYRVHVDAPAGELTGLMSALRHLATLYESHKDYDPSWRVG